MVLEKEVRFLYSNLFNRDCCSDYYRLLSMVVDEIREKKHYKCGYCQKEFDKEVGTSGGEKHSTVSTQVKCPSCGNFLTTWD